MVWITKKTTDLFIKKYFQAPLPRESFRVVPRWRTDFDNLTRSYGYTYDALNRLTNAQYVRPSNPANPNASDIIDTFNETLSYDKNGNIQYLVRNGGMESQTTVPVMDNLVYGYDANDKNKLLKVTDATDNTDGFKDGADNQEEYGYDLNGNMTRDDNKGITSIVYNHLNLPTKIEFNNDINTKIELILDYIDSSIFGSSKPIVNVVIKWQFLLEICTISLTITVN